jgi:hypothetical protein
MEQTLELLDSLALDLAAKFNRYDNIVKYGELGGKWTDGHALNVARADIIAIKEKLGSYVSEKYRCYCEREVPPEVSELYMMRGDEILANAKETLQAICDSEDYDFLVKNSEKLGYELRTQIKLDGTFYEVERLSKLISNNRLEVLRKYEDKEIWLRKFKVCHDEFLAALEEQNDLETEDKTTEPEIVTVTTVQQGLFPGMETLISKEEYVKNPYEELHSKLLRYGVVLADACFTGENNVRIRLIEYDQERYVDCLKDGNVTDISKVSKLLTFNYQVGKEIE